MNKGVDGYEYNGEPNPRPIYEKFRRQPKARPSEPKVARDIKIITGPRIDIGKQLFLFLGGDVTIPIMLVSNWKPCGGLAA